MCTVPARLQGLEGNANGASMSGGFSLHAGVDIQPGQRAKLERLCRYVSRPPVATEHLTMTSSGQVRYQLKTAYRDGTTHIVLEPLDLMARLAALVPPPRMHLTRFHGVFAPHSQLRALVTPAHRGIGGKSCPQPQADQAEEQPPCQPASKTDHRQNCTPVNSLHYKTRAPVPWLATEASTAELETASSD